MRLCIQWKKEVDGKVIFFYLKLFLPLHVYFISRHKSRDQTKRGWSLRQKVTCENPRSRRTAKTKTTLFPVKENEGNKRKKKHTKKHTEKHGRGTCSPRCLPMAAMLTRMMYGREGPLYRVHVSFLFFFRFSLVSAVRVDVRWSSDAAVWRCGRGSALFCVVSSFWDHIFFY